MSALKMARYKSHQVLDVEKKLDDLSHYWRQVQEQTLQKEESLALQQKHQDILRDTSYWLNMIEEWLSRTETCELEDIIENNEVKQFIIILFGLLLHLTKVCVFALLIFKIKLK